MSSDLDLSALAVRSFALLRFSVPSYLFPDDDTSLAAFLTACFSSLHPSLAFSLPSLCPVVVLTVVAVLASFVLRPVVTLSAVAVLSVLMRQKRHSMPVKGSMSSTPGPRTSFFP